MDKRKERGWQFVVVGGDTAEIFEALEKTFNLIVVFVDFFVVLLCVSLVLAWGNTSKSLPIQGDFLYRTLLYTESA